jgi:hypothetical protein
MSMLVSRVSLSVACGFRVQYVVLGRAAGFGPVVSEREEPLMHATRVIDSALFAFLRDSRPGYTAPMSNALVPSEQTARHAL